MVWGPGPAVTCEATNELNLFVSSSGRSSKTAVCLTSESQERRAVQPTTEMRRLRELITMAQFVVTGITLAGRGSIQLHVQCFQLWDDERRAPKS